MYLELKLSGCINKEVAARLEVNICSHQMTLCHFAAVIDLHYYCIAGFFSLQVIQLIQKGGHPEAPEDCPAHQLMMQCWDRNPKKRPGFSSLTDAIQQLTE